MSALNKLLKASLVSLLNQLTREVTVIAIAITISLSCGTSDPVTEDAPKDEGFNIPNKKAVYPATSSECENGTSLSWGSFGQAFFERHCTSCHSSDLDTSRRSGATSTSNFDTYSSVIKQRSKILLYAGKLTGAKMPPTNTVPLDERKALIEYLKCGAPE